MQKWICSLPCSRDHTSGASLGTTAGFHKQLGFLICLESSVKILHATGLGCGFNSQAQGDVPNSTHVECAFLLPSFLVQFPTIPCTNLQL